MANKGLNRLKVVLVQQIQKSLEVAKAKWENERKEDEV